VPSLRSRIVPTGRMHRLARMVGRRNTLKRPVDRLEGAILIALVAMFGVAVAVGAILGTRTYAAQRAAASGLRPVTAVLIQPGPPAGSLPRLGQARASWPAPGGGERSGVLTTATVPGIVGAAAGSRMPVWLNSAGQPAAPPPGQAVMIIYALVTSGAVAAIAVVALLIAYAVARYALDRRRLAAWELAWAWTGPSWTARR
jgi:hypothetical protein